MTQEVNKPFCLKKANNVRELGGYRNADGRTLKKGIFLRGDSLSELSEEDLFFLQSYGLTTCVDLRIDREKGEKIPFADCADIVYYPVSILGDFDLNIRPSDILYHLYTDICDNHGDELAHVLNLLADAEGCAVFHCSAGKDRTGITAMLILSICGADRRLIVSDYAVSGDNIKKNVEAQIQMLKQAGLPDIPLEIFQSPRENMERLLGYLDEKYGSVNDYLERIGVGKKLRQRLYYKMVEA